MECQVCKKDFEKLGGLHLHISKAHLLSQQDYYYYYYPRYDLGDNELIVYKNHNQYFETNFNTRDSFLDWLQNNWKSHDVKKYFIETLKTRIQKKSYNFLPGQVVLKSLFLPSIQWLSRIYGDLETLLKELSNNGIGIRHTYNFEKIEFNYTNLTIYTDTKEQRALSLGCDTKSMCLNIGDYTASGDNFSNTFIERKSLSDLIGTLSSGIDRFERELEKASNLGAYIVVVIEDTYSNAINYKSSIFGQKVNGQNIFFEIRRLSEKYNNVQFVFSGSRNKSSEIIKKIFLMKEKAQHLDLEYLKDIGEI